MGRRRLVGIGFGLGTLGVGLFILAEQAAVAGQLQPLVGSALGSGGAAVAGFTPYGNLSYLVYAIGIGLVVSGIGLIRSIFRTSVAGYVSGGSAGAMGMSPEALQKMMETSMTRMQTSPAASAIAVAPKETVKVKCRNCGSLEAEDAAFCHKCGQAI